MPDDADDEPEAVVFRTKIVDPRPNINDHAKNHFSDLVAAKEYLEGVAEIRFGVDDVEWEHSPGALEEWVFRLDGPVDRAVVMTPTVHDSEDELLERVREVEELMSAEGC